MRAGVSGHVVSGAAGSSPSFLRVPGRRPPGSPSTRAPRPGRWKRPGDSRKHPLDQLETIVRNPARRLEWRHSRRAVRRPRRCFDGRERPIRSRVVVDHEGPRPGNPQGRAPRAAPGRGSWNSSPSTIWFPHSLVDSPRRGRIHRARNLGGAFGQGLSMDAGICFSTSEPIRMEDRRREDFRAAPQKVFFQ
jgi:hypothetical protein